MVADGLHYEILDSLAAPKQQPQAGAGLRVGGHDLAFRYDLSRAAWDDRFGSSMWRYWPLLPLKPGASHVTLHEGGTPLLRSRLYESHQVWWKDETRNPTGSHKDRALSLGVNHALLLGARLSAVVSAGSTGLSHAAFTARAGLRSLTLMASGTPEERSYPVFCLGSRVLQVEAEIDPIIHVLEDVGPDLGIYINSTTRKSNAYQAEAPKTIAYEIGDSLGDAPDWMIVPVGGGGTISAILRGFKELSAIGRVGRLPRLVGVVPRRFNALEVAFREGIETAAEYEALQHVSSGPTILSKLAHALPPDGFEALVSIRESGGGVVSVDDDEALAAQAKIAEREGMYVEPSSATVAVATSRLIEGGAIRPGETVVGLVCGSGFRETFVSMKLRPMPAQRLPLDRLSAVLQEAAAR